MDLESILTPGSVRLDFLAADKERTLAAVGGFAAGLLGLDPARVLSSLRSRESLGSTALGGGIMVPHGKLEGLEGIRLFLFKTAPGWTLDFDSPDGLPVRLIALILAPLEPAPGYLRLLTILGRFWESAQNVDALMRCPDEESFRRTFIRLAGSAAAP
ncbi:MAG: PTS sugar transporter subunit IIA [Deltaproteobacteria bacterium]|jgi:PTS system nitrogen regulatory IIA component|nr:PTS sugar transporter subunit IIA [Deltaproteobacteria bacterium]